MMLTGQVVTFFLFAVLPYAARTAMMNYAMVSSGDKFELRWTYSDNMLHFKMKCKGLGWCAVGFSTQGDGSGMVEYDIAAGGVMNGNTYLQDYWSTGQVAPPADETNNFMNASASEADGYTTVEFYRNATTNETMEDVQFMNDTEVWIMYGLHSSMDEMPLATKHDSRGRITPGTRHNLIMEAMNAPSPTTAATTAAVTTNSSPSKAGSCALGFAILVLTSCILSL